MRPRGAGLDIRRAVVTVPANSRGLARLRTKICAGMVGIEVPVLINEPTAAAMAFGLRTSIDQNVLVIDWGGGTLDVTLLQVAEGVFIEQASKGVSRLGGIDIDKVIFQRLTEDLPETSTWTEAEIGAAMLEIEKAKIRLSSHDETSVALPRGHRREHQSLSFQRVDRAASSNGCWYRSVPSSRRAKRLVVSVDAVLLVGGSCKIPAVRDAVTALIGKEPLRGAVDPMTAIAEGAAIAAAILEQQYDGDFFVGLEHALGTAIVGEHNTGLEFAPVLKRNVKLPAKAVGTFFPVVDHQPTVRIRSMGRGRDQATRSRGQPASRRIRGRPDAPTDRRIKDRARVPLRPQQLASRARHRRCRRPCAPRHRSADADRPRSKGARPDGSERRGHSG